MAERGDVFGLRTSFAKSSRIAVEGAVASWKCRSSDAQGDNGSATPCRERKCSGNSHRRELCPRRQVARCSHRAITRIGCARCADDDDDAACLALRRGRMCYCDGRSNLREAPWMSASMTVVAQSAALLGLSLWSTRRSHKAQTTDARSNKEGPRPALSQQRRDSHSAASAVREEGRIFATGNAGIWSVCEERSD